MDPAYWPSSCVLAARGGLQDEDRSEEDQRACLDCRDRRSFFRRLPTDVSAESNLAAPDFQTKASFDLVVQKSGPQTWRGQIGNPERIRHVHE
jgi:hypothetical protein